VFSILIVGPVIIDTCASETTAQVQVSDRKGETMKSFSAGLANGVWVKSSESEGVGDCVQVTLASWVGVRDSKNPDGPILWFTAGEWNAFLAGVRKGEFTLA
jgi:hypothetical protein